MDVAFDRLSDAGPLGVAVWAPDASLRFCTGGLAQPAEQAPDVFVFAGESWADLFRAFVVNLSAHDRRRILAAPLDQDQRFVPWNSVALETMLKRVETPWLPDVLRGQGLFAHFQPIADASTRQVYGYEALARATVNELTVTGGELLEAARAHQALKEFDEATRRRALREASHGLGGKERLFINVLPSALLDPEVDFDEFWCSAQNWGLDASRVVFEILETDEMPCLDSLAEFVAHVRSHGANIALDDVGAGHSSLVHIQELKPDLVKFDRGLLPLAPTDATVKLLAGLNEYAQSHGCVTLMEGVETEPQLDVVRYCGFDLVQGWLIGRPARLDVRVSVQ
jgi:EAL domain-containing protein (putative c-di-GMP-specific phosphodiesterase class I)